MIVGAFGVAAPCSAPGLYPKPANRVGGLASVRNVGTPINEVIGHKDYRDAIDWKAFPVDEEDEVEDEED